MRIGGALARTNPALALFLLSPVLGEVASGHLSPLEFLNPVRFAITVVPYGCGALIVREVSARRQKGWLSRVLLGLAFGLYFEGIVTRVIFNPDWEGLGPLGAYSHAHGVNWVLAVGLIHFHAMVSIVSSILVLEMLYPERRETRWVGGRTLIVCGVLLLVWPLVLGLLSPYIPPLAGAAALLGLAAALAVGALLAQADSAQPSGRRPLPPLIPGLVAGAGMWLIMLGTFVVPTFKFRPPMPLTLAALLLILVLECVLLTRWNRRPENRTARHHLAQVTGFLSFFLLVGGLQDLEGFRGYSLVSAATVWLLWRLWYAASAAGRARPPASPLPRPPA